jgi:hypothetical protein
MKAFENFITESKVDAASSAIASDIVNVIKRLSGQAKMNLTLEYRSLANAIIHLNVIRGELPAGSAGWEEINYKRHGFSLDSSAYIQPDGQIGINVDLYIRPTSEPACYSQLEYDMTDSIRHEIEHRFHTDKSQPAQRHAHKDTYRYFLLPDEIPSMVSGLSLSAKREGIAFSAAVANYLTPFVESGFITVDQFDHISQVWSDWANSH